MKWGTSGEGNSALRQTSGRFGCRCLLRLVAVQAHRLDSASLHLDHFEGPGTGGHPVSHPGKPAELAEDVAADGGIVGIVEGGVELAVELRNRHRSVDTGGSI